MEILEAIITAVNQFRGTPRELRVSRPVRHAILDDARRKRPILPVRVDDITNPEGCTLRFNGLPVIFDQNVPSDGLCVVGANETVMVLNLTINQGDSPDGKAS